MRLSAATVRNVQRLCVFDDAVVDGWCQLTVDALFNSPSKSLSTVAGSIFRPIFKIQIKFLILKRIYFFIFSAHLNITLFDAEAITKSLTNILIDAAKENVRLRLISKIQKHSTLSENKNNRADFAGNPHRWTESLHWRESCDDGDHECLWTRVRAARRSCRRTQTQGDIFAARLWKPSMETWC